MPVARCVMPVPENFQTGKCPFARCPKKIKRANARCPLPDYSCPLASLDILEALITALETVIDDLRRIYKDSLDRLVYFYFQQSKIIGVVALGGLNLVTLSTN